MQKRLLFILLALSIQVTYAIEVSRNKPLKPGLRFVENKGQWERPVVFRANIAMGRLFLERNALTYLLIDPYRMSSCHHPDHCKDGDHQDHDLIDCHAVRMQFTGAREGIVPEGRNSFPEYHNYFVGNDSAAWASFVPLFGEVVYPGLYPGIDLVVKSDFVHLKYEYLVTAGADPGLIRATYTGMDGIRLEGDSLVLKTTVNDLVEQAPFAYQLWKGDTLVVPCRYALEGTTVHFSFPQGYRTDLPLVIDPVVVAATYAGSVGSSTYGHSATYDEDGYIYTGGRSFGPGYPVTTGAFQTSFGGSVDIAISKFSPDGTSLEWASYIGGSSDEYAQSLVTNQNSELFIYGSSQSPNYPVTTGCFQPSKGLQYDIILTRLNFTGSALIGSTYIGGNANDGQNTLSVNYGDIYRGEIILDSQGNPCVASFSSSGNFPTTPGAFDQTHNGNQDGVVFKMNSDLTSLIWSTYLGGSNHDAAYGLKLNIVDMVYVAGGTQSTDFPTTPWVLNPTYMGGSHDGFMCIFMPDISSMIAGSFYGTNAFDEIFFIQMDEENNVYVYGQSDGNIWVSPGCYGNPGSHQFIVKFDQTLNGILFSTVFGSGNQAGSLSPTAFLVDLCQNVYAAGWGVTNGFPVTPDAVQPTTDGADFYLMVLKKDAEELLYATFYGSEAWEHVDGGTSRFDKNGIIYEAVCEGSPNFPCTPGAYASYSSVAWDLAVFKIDFQLSGPSAAFSANPATTGCAPLTVSFTNNSTNANEYLWDFADGSGFSSVENPVHVFTTPGVYNVACIAIDSSSCFISDTAFIEITILAVPVVDLGTDTLMCGVPELTLDAGNPGNTYLWSDNSDGQQLTVAAPGTYWVKVFNATCVSSDTIVVDFMIKPDLGPDITLCTGLPASLDAGMPGFQYEWLTGETTQTITVYTTNDYWVGVSRDNCTLYDTIAVFFKPLPVVDLGPDQAVCEGQGAMLDAGNPGSLYTWNTGSITQTIMVYATGNYWVDVVLDGCSSGDTVNVNVLPIPTVDLLGDRILCEGDVMTLDAGNPGYSYIWNTGETTQTIVITSTGSYSVTVTAQGCSGSDTVNATVISLDVDLGNDTLLCPEQTIVLDAGNPGSDYFWNNGETGRTKVVKSSGVYWVRVSRYLCIAADTIRVDQMQQVNLPSQLNLCGHESLILEAGIEADNYSWSDGSVTPSIEIFNAGMYTLRAGKGHCTLEDSTEVIGKSGIQTFYVPNAFSPNHDGVNDDFLPKGSDLIYFHMQVFNRWGQLIHTSMNVTEGWNGTYEGEPVPDGIYFYVIRYATECSFEQEFQEVGTVLVLR